MPAYLIADVDITDPKGFDEYRTQVPPTMALYGGRYLVRGGAAERLEGHWQPRRLVVLEFPTLDQARRWYESEAYRGPRALRWKAAKTNLVLVEGIGPS